MCDNLYPYIETYSIKFTGSQCFGYFPQNYVKKSQNIFDYNVSKLYICNMFLLSWISDSQYVQKISWWDFLDKCLSINVGTCFCYLKVKTKISTKFKLILTMVPRTNTGETETITIPFLSQNEKKITFLMQINKIAT